MTVCPVEYTVCRFIINMQTVSYPSKGYAKIVNFILINDLYFIIGQLKMARKFDLTMLQAKLNTKPVSRNNSSRYPFWNMRIDESATVRFLPDKNEDNPWFLIEYHSHELMIDGKKRSIPCLKQYGEDCPMCKRSQEFFTKEGKDSVRGKQMYRKRSWLGQVLVVKDPLPVDVETGENNDGLYKTVSLGAQIYDSLVAAIKEGDVESAPHAYEDGTNFVIRKTQSESKGRGKESFAEYNRSRFEKYPSALSSEVVEYIEENIVDLEDIRPSKPEKSYLLQQMTAFLREDSDDDQDEYEAPTKRVSSFNETTSSKPAALFSDDEDEYEAPAPKVKKPVYVPESSDDDEDEDALSMLNRLRGKSSKPE